MGIYPPFCSAEIGALHAERLNNIKFDTEIGGFTIWTTDTSALTEGINSDAWWNRPDSNRQTPPIGDGPFPCCSVKAQPKSHWGRFDAGKGDAGSGAAFTGTAY